jgi:hypothetical protein
MSKIIDICTFNSEHDLWDIHYNVLKDYVDEFIVVEFDRTFSGKAKQQTFKGMYDKVTYHFCEKWQWDRYLALAHASPNTQGADHWKTEFAQKESLKDFLMHLDGDDIVFVGDVDEVWKPYPVESPIKLRLLVYTYHLNLRSSETFHGTLAGYWKDIKNECLNHLRTNTTRTYEPYGWHFTSMGGANELKDKLTDSYTNESYATDEVLAGIDIRYGNADFLGRDFAYAVDESDWPQWLKDNRQNYKHLLK